MAEYARPADWPDVPLVDTDVHITPRSLGALVAVPARAVARLRPRERGREPGVRPLPAALAALRDPRRPTGRRAARLRPRAPARPAARPVAPARRRHALHLRRRRHPQPRLGRRHGARGQRLAARRVAAADPRLRGSVVVAGRRTRTRRRRRSTGSATAPSSCRCSCPCGSRAPLGSRAFWPIYEAAERHGLAVAVYAGGAGGNPLDPGRVADATTWRSTSGWPRRSRPRSSAWSARACSARSPTLPVVLVESGFTWLPPLMWRFDKNWKGLRREVPWVDRLPSEMIREHVRLTVAAARRAARRPRPAAAR